MSIKTLRKRIALVAVSALGVGLLSVAPASAATSLTTNVSASRLFISTTASTTGSASWANNGAASTDGKSIGYISETSATPTTAANGGVLLATGAAATAVVYAGAQIAFAASNIAATNNSGVSVVVTGGTLSGIAGTGGTASINGSATTAVVDAATASGDEDYSIYGVLTVSAPAGSTATLTAYAGADITGTTTATNGALLGTWTFTVASASLSQAYSAADSTITVQAPIAKGATPSTSVGYDNTALIPNGQVGYIYMDLEDAYGAQIVAASTVSLTATSSASTIIGHATAASANSYAATAQLTSIAGANAGVYYIVVNQPVANTAGSTTVTIQLNGATIATKTLRWSGIAASLVVDTANSANIFSQGYSPTYDGGGAVAVSTRNLNIIYVVKDAAGNAIDVADAATKLSVSDATGSMAGAALAQADSTGTAAAGTVDFVAQTSSEGYGLATMSNISSILDGAGTYRLAYVNAAGTVIKSPVINATVSAGANTFEAAWDKAQYNPGDIATLTITAKDAKGNLVADGVALGTTALITVNTDGLTHATASCDGTAIQATTVVYSGGKKICKFAVKNTPGAYSYTVSIPTASSQAATVGTAKIVSATTSVTNAEVLAAIVKLIASINKQIKALQKSLRR